MKKGFTLIELLVVVLIIGILAAIALPMYNKAVIRSRFAALMPIVKAMNDSNEVYYLEHHGYASNPQDLPIQGQLEYPDGTTLEFGQNMDYAYVLASNPDARNNYIMYQKHSENYPGEIHCEAVTGDALAESICAAYGTSNIGSTLTEGYTTYVIEGSGVGLPPGYNALLEQVDCAGAEALGFSCENSVDEENHTVTKKICTTVRDTNYCRVKTRSEDGSYTSLTCVANAEKVCTSQMQNVTYNANGQRTSLYKCDQIQNDGTCSRWCYGSECGHRGYEYDENGNLIRERNCYKINDGVCQYSGTGYDYQYDANGNKKMEIRCRYADLSDGSCTEYIGEGAHSYTYDNQGRVSREYYCIRLNSSNTGCDNYRSANSYTYTYKGNLVTRCTMSASSTCLNFEEIYDSDGKKISRRECNSVNSAGTACKTYKQTTYDYVYDDDGMQLSEQWCNGSTLDTASGTCISYNWGGGPAAY